MALELTKTEANDAEALNSVVTLEGLSDIFGYECFVDYNEADYDYVEGPAFGIYYADDEGIREFTNYVEIDGDIFLQNELTTISDYVAKHGKVEQIIIDLLTAGDSLRFIREGNWNIADYIEHSIEANEYDFYRHEDGKLLSALNQNLIEYARANFDYVYNQHAANYYASVVTGEIYDIAVLNNGKLFDYLRDASEILGKTDYRQLTETELKEICLDFVNDCLV